MKKVILSKNKIEYELNKTKKLLKTKEKNIVKMKQELNEMKKQSQKEKLNLNKNEEIEEITFIDEIQVPMLYAADFIPKVADPNNDVILFIAEKGMSKYELSIESFKMLIKVFHSIKTVKFYEFNMYKEYVPGLNIPWSDEPLISVWSALKEPKGNSFNGYLSPMVIFENLLKLIKSKISVEKKIEMTRYLSELEEKRRIEMEKKKYASYKLQYV